MRGNLSFIIVLLLAFVFANGLNAAKKQDDGYKVYQQAYNLILDEQWNEASNAFKDMLQRYPKSAWVDDAKFWQCYTLKKQDQPEKAVACYENFIHVNSRSKWINDARANLVKLARQLSSTGNPKYDEILQSMKQSTNEEIALTALYALQHTRDEHVLDAALTLLDRTDNEGVRLQVLQILLLFDSPQVSKIIKDIVINAPSPRMRSRAIFLLIQKKPEGVLELLTDRIFQDVDKGVQNMQHAAAQLFSASGKSHSHASRFLYSQKGQLHFRTQKPGKGTTAGGRN